MNAFPTAPCASNALGCSPAAAAPPDAEWSGPRLPVSLLAGVLVVPAMPPLPEVGFDVIVWLWKSRCRCEAWVAGLVGVCA